MYGNSTEPLIKWNIIHLADASSVRKRTRMSSIIRKIEEFIDMYQSGTNINNYCVLKKSINYLKKDQLFTLIAKVKEYN